MVPRVYTRPLIHGFFIFLERVIFMPGVGLGVIILNELNQVLLILRNENPEFA